MSFYDLVGDRAEIARLASERIRQMTGAAAMPTTIELYPSLDGPSLDSSDTQEGSTQSPAEPTEAA